MLVLAAAAAKDPMGQAANLTASPTPDVYVVNRGEQAEATALQLARELRRAGATVQLDDSGSAFSKQFKRADRCSAKQALVIGDDEVKSGVVRLRALHNQEQDMTFSIGDIDAIVTYLKRD